MINYIIILLFLLSFGKILADIFNSYSGLKIGYELYAALSIAYFTFFWYIYLQFNTLNIAFIIFLSIILPILIFIKFIVSVRGQIYDKFFKEIATNKIIRDYVSKKF